VNPVGIAVIGLGRVGKSHIDGILLNPETCRLAAVVDMNAALSSSLAAQHNVPGYVSVEECLADQSVHAVVICLPHNQHAPVAIRAANAGKHVLVEKVMATTVEDGEEMVAAAEKSGVRLMVGQTRRFIEQLREAKGRLSDIGNVTSVLYSFSCIFDVNTAPPWWRSKEATGGLVYPMLGSHSVDFCLWICDDRTPVSVYASGSSTNPDFEGDDTATIIINFDDGTHATNYLTINNRPTRHEGLVTGSNGSIYFTHGNDHEGLIGVPTTDLFINGAKVREGNSAKHAFAVQMEEFASAILQGREPEASGREVLTQLRILRAAQRSAAEKRVVELD